MTQSIEKLQEIIDTSKDPRIVEQAKKALEKQASLTAAQTQVTASIMGETAQLDSIMNALQSLVNSGVSGGKISDKELRDAIKKELKTRKIDYNDLSDYLKGFLDKLTSSRAVQLTINAMGVVSQVTSAGDPMLNRKLTQLILSDVAAKNNVYLYGGAGTGKTFIANYIAKLLDFTAITLNCNQYTSPLDIVGGQTIDGYQEGKLTQAWGNFLQDRFGNITPIKGAVLILDELPKIDPNTAGILNEALAKVKQFDFDKNSNTPKPPTILNGRNESFTLGNLVVIATGNVPLNTIDPDYEANFKQDLSLQDRFIGSTYKVFVDYEYEFNTIMNGFAFIWIFGTKLRQAIESPEIRATSQAFVSIRLMENLKATYMIYREALETNKTAGATGTASILEQPKTIIEGIDTVLSLIKESQRQQIVKQIDYDGFKRIVEEKNKMPFDKNAPNFNTPQEVEEAEKIIRAYKATQKQI